MRRARIVTPLACLLITGGSLPSVEAKSYQRTARQRYEGAHGNDYLVTPTCSREGTYHGDDDTTVLSFDTLRGERLVQVVIADEIAAMNVIAFVSQGLNRRSGHIICGATERPIPIKGGHPLYVFLFRGLSNKGPSYFTDGVVTATFAR